jgi:hypothetical protein
MVKSTTDALSLDNSDNFDRPSWSIGKIRSARATILAPLAIVAVLGVIYASSSLPHTWNYKVLLTTFTATSTNPQINRSNEIFKVYDTLLERASNRYYLNDFRLIRQEFRLIESASKELAYSRLWSMSVESPITTSLTLEWHDE